MISVSSRILHSFTDAKCRLKIVFMLCFIIKLSSLSTWHLTTADVFVFHSLLIMLACGSVSCVCHPGVFPGQCVCKDGFAGEKCDRCAFGYRDFPSCTRCECSLEGSLNIDPCRECICKVRISAPACSRLSLLSLFWLICIDEIYSDLTAVWNINSLLDYDFQ